MSNTSKSGEIEINLTSPNLLRLAAIILLGINMFFSSTLLSLLALVVTAIFGYKVWQKVTGLSDGQRKSLSHEANNVSAQTLLIICTVPVLLFSIPAIIFGISASAFFMSIVAISVLSTGSLQMAWAEKAETEAETEDFFEAVARAREAEAEEETVPRLNVDDIVIINGQTKRLNVVVKTGNLTFVKEEGPARRILEVGEVVRVGDTDYNVVKVGNGYRLKQAATETA